MKKLLLLAAAGVGYVLGARAGRGRYDQIAGLATKVKNDPRVQDAAHQASETAKAQAPVVKDKVTAAAGSVAGTVADKVRSSGDPDDTDDTATSSGDTDDTAKRSDDSDDLEAKLNPDNVALQDNPYPQGDLP